MKMRQRQKFKAVNLFMFNHTNEMTGHRLADIIAEDNILE